MARLMLSAGIFSAFAAATAVRRRGVPSGSPPALAAMVISLIRRVKALPRFASSAPFLCLIVAHFEWPDMGNLGGLYVLVCGEMPENRNGLEQFPQTISIAGACRRFASDHRRFHGLARFSLQSPYDFLMPS